MGEQKNGKREDSLSWESAWATPTLLRKRKESTLPRLKVCAYRRLGARKRIRKTIEGGWYPGTDRDRRPKIKYGPWVHGIWSVIAIGLDIDNKLD